LAGTPVSALGRIAEEGEDSAMEAAKTLEHLGHLIFLPSATGLDSFKTAPQSGH
jgi:hypothetical protein